MRGGRLVLLVALGLACREGAPAVAHDAGGAEPLRFGAGDPVELVYADSRASFRTARGVAGVPASSRAAVRVRTPGSGDLVHLIDLRAPDRDGRFTTTLVSRLEFERRALAALAPGAGSRVTLGPPGPEVAAPAPAGIVVYGTGWCGACTQARQNLERRRLAYRFRDVEGDPRAAAELAAALAALGVRADRVPVIDLHGRLLVGFEPARLDTLLGESL